MVEKALILNADPALFSIAAPTKADLRDAVRETASRYLTENSPPFNSAGVGSGPHRLALVARNYADLQHKLSIAERFLEGTAGRAELGPEIFHGCANDYENSRKTAFVFPGYSNVAKAMCRELEARFPVVRDWLASVRTQDLAPYLRPVPIVPVDDDEPLNQNDAPTSDEMEQFDSMQSIFLANLASYRLLRSCGLSADAMVGHSYGELAVLVAAGITERPANVFYLLRRIGRATMACSGSSGNASALLAVSTSSRLALQQVLEMAPPKVSLSLDNCPGQVVLSGPIEAIEKVLAAVKARGGIAFRMPELSQPVHTPDFPVPVRRLRKIYGEIPLWPGSIPAFSCTNADLFPADVDKIRELLVYQWLRPVRFRETIERLYEEGYRTFVEAGPGGRVAGFVRDILRGRDAVALAVHQEGRPAQFQLQVTLARLFVRGHDVDLTPLTDVDPPARQTLSGSTRDIAQRILDKVAELAETGGAKPLAIDTGFFDLGLDSFTAVQLAHALEQEFEVSIPETAAFEYPTPESLAQYIHSGTGRKTPIEQRASTGGGSDIAVIGMGLRFPGGVNSPEAFRALLKERRDAITDCPADRGLNLRGGFLDNTDGFDPAFFGISPREAETLDPQQRLLLEVSWEAIEHAGIDAHTLRNTRTGVFSGISGNDYASRLSSAARLAINGYIATGNAPSVSAGRISFVLGLNGPCLAVDTACSSSLVAVHLACQSLRQGESDLGIAGGVNLILSSETSTYLRYGQALSPEDRCKSFDEFADGYVRAEGCGMVLLKRLDDAIAAGDRICAVIRGSAVNHDGRSSGLTVPNADAQQSLLRQALESARVNPADVAYVEAHGTGTSLGDPLEARALAAVYCAGVDRPRPLRIGSVKTNIGHLEAAAGVAGLIKTILQLQYGELAASLHFHRPNPRIDWEKSRLEVVTANVSWHEDRRIAGVSSFGLSGTNAHVIVEAPPVTTPLPERRHEHSILPLSAANESSLRNLVKAYSGCAALNGAADLADVCYTASVGRTHLRRRLAVVGDSPESVRQQLQIVEIQAPRKHRPRIAFLFTGQGSLYPGACKTLYENDATFRRALDQCDRALPLLDTLFSGSAVEVAQTAFQQPALFAVQYALAEMWSAYGVRPEFVAGHSVGEYAAAVVTGMLDVADALRLVSARGACMQKITAAGGMLAVRCSVNEIDLQKDELSIAAVNGPSSTVLSGPTEALAAVQQRLANRGIACTPLDVSHAFHSALMDPAAMEFRLLAASTKWQVPAFPFVSTLTGRVAGDEIRSPDYWVRQLREPVLFADAVATLQGLGCNTFLELGPKPVLTGLGREMANEDEFWLASLTPAADDRKQILNGLGRLYEAGQDIDWRYVYPPDRHRKVELPTYSFDRARYWVDAPAPVHAVVANVASMPGQRLDLPGTEDVRFEFSLEGEPWVQDYRLFRRTVLPLSAYLAFGWATTGTSEIRNLEFSDELRETNVLHAILRPATSSGLELAVHGRSSSGWFQALSGNVQESESLPPITLVSEQDLTDVPPDAFYHACADSGFEYGPTFRVLECLQIGKSYAVGTIATPRLPGQVHPVQVEACLQILGTAVFSSSPDRMYTLRRIERVELKRKFPLRFRVESSCISTHEGMLGSLAIVDASSGEVIGTMLGVLYVESGNMEPEATRSSALASVTREEQPAFVREFLRKTVCRVLRRSASVALEEDEPFRNLGMDSLMAMELSNTVQTELGARLPIRNFIGDSSIHTLASEIIASLSDTTTDDSSEWVEGVL